MPRDGSATKQRILDTAERLIIENGYAATSVDHVIAESGTSKGAFFHHFDSKLALARALVERYAAADIAQLEDALAKTAASTDDPRERIVEFIQIFEDKADELMAAQSSCLYVSILTERQLARSGTADQIVAAILAWRAGVAQLLRDALVGRADIDVAALADHLFVTFEGAFLLSRSTGDPGHMRAQLRVYRQLIESLLVANA
jgi:TetR/AcrR family transcriptional repressor of nem operon